MPRTKRDDGPSYTLDADEIAFEMRLHKAAQNAISKIEAVLENPKSNLRDVNAATSALVKLQAERRNHYKTFGKLLAPKDAASDPEVARQTAMLYLQSLSLLDRVAVISGAYPEDTIVQYLAQEGAVKTRSIIQRVKVILDNAGAGHEESAAEKPVEAASGA